LIGVGIDAVDVTRFRAIMARRSRFAARVFTAAELADLAGRRDQVPGLAARFAAKEATMKALGVGVGRIGLSEIEVARAASGAPSVVLAGRAAERAAELGVAALHLSMTHTDALASAIVVAE
jgi:holo-[acyl-carrier protein] synthase